MQRFTGWTLVLAGLIYSLCWLVAPLDVARVASTAAVATGLALVAARATWSAIRG